MADFNVRADSVNVEQIMEQIRGRIREKRGVDYTEQQIRELAAVKLEKYLDPKGVRSELLAEFHRVEPDQNYAFEDDTLFETHRAPIRWLRSLFRPLLKLFFNPNPLAHVLHMQSQINDRHASRDRLYYELIHNLVVETTRLGIEVKNLTMRVESLSSRVEFNERRARALESAVVYRPTPEQRAPDQPPRQIAVESAPSMTSSSQSAQGAYGGGSRPAAEGAPAVEAGAIPGIPGGGPGTPGPGGPGQRSRRRRRRRGRRGAGGPASAIMGQPAAAEAAAEGPEGPEGSEGPEEPQSHEPSASSPEEPGNDSEQ